MDSTHFSNFIDGHWKTSSAPTFIKYSPWDGSSLGTVTQSEPLDVIQALPGLKKAQSEWENTTFLQRSEVLRKIVAVLKKNCEEWALQEAEHQGLAFESVKKYSFEHPIAWGEQICLELEQRSAAKEKHHTKLRPTGLIGVMLPWCLSLRLALKRIFPALAAGNGLIIKVSEHSPITGSILGQIFLQVPECEGLVQILQGKGETIGPVLAGHPSLKGFSFVGSHPHAELMMSAALPRWKKLNILSGVKNSICVLEEIQSVEHLQKALSSAFWGSGQTCWSAQRIFILEAHKEAFKKHYIQMLNQLQPAASSQDLSPWTPMISRERLQNIDSKKTQVLAEQGHIWPFKILESGFFMQPMVTEDLSHCSDLQQEDLLGPLLILTSVKYQHEIAKWLNTTSYGHSAVIWGPEEKAIKVADTLVVSQVFINHWEIPKETTRSLKQSSWGEQDLSWDGPFFSDATQFLMQRPSKN